MNNTCALCPQPAEFDYEGRDLCSSCVSSEAAKKQSDGPVTKKRERNRGKKIAEVQSDKNYSGEASPYWDDLRERPWQNDDGQLLESAEANPDMLPEEASFYHHTPTDDEEMRAEILRDVIGQLTPLQQRALSLCEEPGYTEEKAAETLGMTRRAFRTIIDRITKTIETKYEQRQRSSPWQK